MIVNLGTQITQVFGQLDDEGNLVRQIPVDAIQLSRFSPQILAEIGAKLEAMWAKLKAEEVAAQPVPAPPPAPPVDAATNGQVAESVVPV